MGRGPPNTVYKASEFASHHQTYAEDRERNHTLPPDCSFSAWFGSNLKALEAYSYDRDRVDIVAVVLLQSFRAEPTLWSDCGWLNSWDPHKNETFNDYLNS